ncbi:hypothetical protein [Flavobacterium proteolyticum]|jgi:hypothetical protein|uniref:Uncharacterized protein n=1 Tax=Flavobacterium proteolyticum TaxID=2911683 RepID=A0ABR9WMS1_9FLAO|nr:hypothetical protein [Flavobacterium proteolyticum]MBE9575208.1 hypothetical protein [Flavobacterium proteolyticum]
MRLGVVFSLFFAFGFAQEKHLTSDFHLSKDVTKYESVEYKYNAAIKNFEVSETEILEFQEGKLVQRTHQESGIFGGVMNKVEKFTYDQKGQLLKIEAEGRYPKQFFYDKSGKLVKIFMDRNTEASISEDFTYDKKGNLIKWVKKTGNAIDEERTFFNYINPKSYKYNLKYYQSQKNELLFSEEGEYKSGNKIAYKHISAKDSKETFYNLEYDVYGNLIKSSSNANYLYETVYAYDEKGNVIKERSNDAADLYSKFSKITFKDGTTSGSTTFAPYFTKGIQQPILLMPMNKNPKEKYKVMKTGPTHYEVKNSKGQIVPINPKESLIFEQKDMFFYDAKTNETVVLFGLFTNAYKSNEWYETVTYNSPTGKYIVVNTDWNFFILEKGNVVESSQYKLHKGIDGNTLVIAENGKEKFFVPHLDQMQALVIYPLELISK